MVAINEPPESPPVPDLTCESSKKWKHKGSTLLSLDDGGKRAVILACSCDAPVLRALAQACLEAAAEMDGGQ